MSGNPNQMPQQAVVVTSHKAISDHRNVEKFALFAPDGSPIDLHANALAIKELQDRLAALEAKQFAPFKDTGDPAKE